MNDEERGGYAFLTDADRMVVFGERLLELEKQHCLQSMYYVEARAVGEVGAQQMRDVAKTVDEISARMDAVRGLIGLLPHGFAKLETPVVETG